MASRSAQASAALNSHGLEQPLKNALRLSETLHGSAVNENHPVLFALSDQLQALRQAYSRDPSEHNRYHLVRLESLIEQWAPGQAAAFN